MHKLLCKQFKNFSTPPNTLSRRAIYFHVSGGKPRFVWVVCVMRPAERGPAPQEYADMSPYLGDDPSVSLSVRANPFRLRDTQHTMQVACQQATLVGGSVSNSSIIETTQGIMPYDWRGPVLVMKKRGTGHHGPYDHMDMIDFRNLVDFFCNHGDWNLGDMEGSAGANHEKTKTPKQYVNAVRINCLEDRVVRGRGRYEVTMVAENDPIFDSPVITTARFTGLPIQVRKCVLGHKLHHKEDDQANPAAKYLCIECFPSLERDWVLPPEWEDYSGSVIVVRQDRLPLTVQHTHMLCVAGQDVLRPLLEDINVLGSVEARSLTPAARLERFPPWARDLYDIGDNLIESDPNWRQKFGLPPRWVG